MRQPQLDDQSRRERGRPGGSSKAQGAFQKAKHGNPCWSTPQQSEHEHLKKRERRFCMVHVGPSRPYREVAKDGVMRHSEQAAIRTGNAIRTGYAPLAGPRFRELAAYAPDATAKMLCRSLSIPRGPLSRAPDCLSATLAAPVRTQAAAALQTVLLRRWAETLVA